MQLLVSEQKKIFFRKLICIVTHSLIYTLRFYPVQFGHIGIGYYVNATYSYNLAFNIFNAN